ncbi:MAG: 50S ribosomal protein L22 [Bacteroidota bacterium]
MRAVAKLRNCPMSARKMRLVVDLIRGKEVNDALDILAFTKKEAAVWLEKIVLSAIANWEDKLGHTENADDYELVIVEARSDQGPMLKRFRPAPHGRAHRIRKHTNHITIAVENQVPLPNEETDNGIEEVELEEEAIENVE